MSDQPQSPLERAIQGIKEMHEHYGNNSSDESHHISAGIYVAESICQRILDETKGEPEEKQKWEIAIYQHTGVMDSYGEHQILQLGYEPFAVDQGIIYFKRVVK